MTLSVEVRRAMDRIPRDDPTRALVELVLEDDNPTLLAAVIRRLVAEIRAERVGSAVGMSPEDNREARAVSASG